MIEIMYACCTGKARAIEQLRRRQTVTLRAVLLVNAAMFGVEFVAGLLAGSVSREAREELARQRAQPSLQQTQNTFLPGPG